MSDEAQHKQLARRLRLAREQAGLSQEAVARKLGLKRPAISEIEAGRRKVSATELVSLSDLYHASMDWLMSEHPLDSEKIELAARGLARLKSEDLDHVMKLLRTLRDPPERRE